MTPTDDTATAQRTGMVGHLRSSHVGDEVRLAGWVHRRRDLGGLVFVDLRDRSGLAQVSFGPDWTDQASLDAAGGLGAEAVVAVRGEVVRRPEANPDLATGEVEVRARSLEVLAAARTPAIPVYRAPEDDPPSEELRLKHRVLDLRRPEMQRALELRHRLVLATRNYLDDLGFVEVETPVLTRPTPEGARDFLVPSRVHPGEFYALPQSPQIYKQILMVAGMDRYFQIARCFRDEDFRADRQAEFTQIDVEASFVGIEDILSWMEGLMASLAEVAGVEAALPFPRMSWAEALDRYGTDRPDLRWNLAIQDWSEELGDTDFRVLNGALSDGGRIRGLRIEGGASMSRRQIDGVEDAAKDAGAPGLLWVKRSEEGGSGPLARFLEEEHYGRLGMEAGDLALVAAGPDPTTSPALDATRRAVIETLELPRDREHAWLWVTDFPVFEETEHGELTPNHHPFVLPHPDDVHLLGDRPLEARGLAYDLVYDGTEFGSGSIRIHDPDLQMRIFRILGLEEEEARSKFGFLLDALGAGAPPHGGIAFGMDRIVQRFAGVGSIRDVIAFPKTTAARALFEGAPAPMDDDVLAGLRLRAAP
jgi:aspartyl-tRNA synthetase